MQYATCATPMLCTLPTLYYFHPCEREVHLLEFLLKMHLRKTASAYYGVIECAARECNAFLIHLQICNNIFTAFCFCLKLYFLANSMRNVSFFYMIAACMRKKTKAELKSSLWEDSRCEDENEIWCFWLACAKQLIGIPFRIFGYEWRRLIFHAATWPGMCVRASPYKYESRKCVACDLNYLSTVDYRLYSTSASAFRATDPTWSLRDPRVYLFCISSDARSLEFGSELALRCFTSVCMSISCLFLL
jgi:hypothetical protein